mgnify:CR=1 FL=1
MFLFAVNLIGDSNTNCIRDNDTGRLRICHRIHGYISNRVSIRLVSMFIVICISESKDIVLFFISE